MHVRGDKGRLGAAIGSKLISSPPSGICPRLGLKTPRLDGKSITLHRTRIIILNCHHPALRPTIGESEMDRHQLATFGLLLAAGAPAALFGQGRPDPAVLIPAQRQALTSLAFMDGAWRGPAWTILPSGEKHNITQTERIGPFLDGSVKVIEGRGYGPDGKVAFNAFGTISYNPATKAFTMHSYAQGSVGDFVLTPNAEGYAWDIPAGPMTIRYTATIKNGEWHEVGDRIMPGKDPIRFFEMKLKRIGDTTWPAGGAIPMK
jgi:hypothetical protein